VGENLAIWFVEKSCNVSSGCSKTNSVGKALAKSTSGGFNFWNEMVLRMPCCAAAKLAELLELIHGNNFAMSAEMKKSVDESRSMATGKNKSVTI